MRERERERERDRERERERERERGKKKRNKTKQNRFDFLYIVYVCFVRSLSLFASLALICIPSVYTATSPAVTSRMVFTSTSVKRRPTITKG